MSYQKGFTIIEVMLFLVVTSALAIMLVTSTGVAIQRQQYKDSVQSFASFWNNQYGKIVSPENERSATEQCPLVAEGSVERGRSECVIIGRYVFTEDNGAGNQGRRYVVRPIYSYKQVGLDRVYALGEQVGNYELGWGTRTRLSGQGDNSSLVSVLMYRHPENGLMAVKSSPIRFTDSNLDEIANLINTGGASGEAQELCVYDPGWIPGQRRSVLISAGAGSGDAVTVINSSGACSAI